MNLYFFVDLQKNWLLENGCSCTQNVAVNKWICRSYLILFHLNYDNFYSSSKAEIIINESDVDDVFKSIYTTVIRNIQRSLGKGSGWIIDPVIDHTISISKYNPLAGRSYEKLRKELDHPRKGLINIQNIGDNEYFKWCLVRYLNPADHHPARIAKTEKDFVKRLDFRDIKFPVKIKDIHKIKNKKNSLSISIFGYENKEKQPICVSKKCWKEKHVYSLLIGEGETVFIKDFNTFMYDHTLHHGRKHFCCYCLQAFRRTWNNILWIALKLMANKLLRCLKKVNIKSPFMIYADFEIILVPEDNGKQNPNESYCNLKNYD